MYGKTELCNKIHEIYPEIGECNKDLSVTWDYKKMSGESFFKKKWKTDKTLS